MANLLGQNIGTNYKGILNLNTLNGNLSGTLESVTDGDGNASPLRLSNTQAAVSGQLSVLKDSGTLAYIGNTAGNSGFNFLFNQISAIGGNAFYISNTGSNIIFEVSSVERGRFTGANFVLGHTSAAARLHVRGDGTNPHFLTQDSSGTERFRIGASGATNSDVIFNDSGIGQRIRWENRFISITSQGATISSSASEGVTSGNASHLTVTGTFAAAAGSGTYRPLNIAYTINNSGAQTGTATGIFLNATETALTGMNHNLMDLQVGGSSQFTIMAGNGLRVASDFRMHFNTRSSIYSPADGLIQLTNSSRTDFSRLQFGGTTNAFPALKRNGAALEVRLADDSGFANFQVNLLTSSIISNSSRIISQLPTTRPATVGEFYQDTAANILANGDKVVGIRV